MPTSRRPIETIPMSTDAGKIEFFGTLMPALMLLKASPLRFLGYQVDGFFTPRLSVVDYIASACDDAARVEDTLVFVHRWGSATFDPFTFARAKTFLRKLASLLHQAGYRAEPVTPLSPALNLPKLAVSAGLGS